MKKFGQIFKVIIISLALLSNLQARTPKNIILMISDGCGYNHIEAANLFQHGTPGAQIYEQFPVKYGMSTYPINGIGYDPDSAWSHFDYVRRKATDSAASGTALATGVKTYNGAIGVDSSKHKIMNIIEHAEKLGKATGVVTTVVFCHATPASFVAHNEKRSNYTEIARELILESHVEVIMGAGHPYYDENGLQRSDTSYRYVGGKDVWTTLLSSQAGNDADGDSIADPWRLIQNRIEFQQLMEGATPKRVIGIPKVAKTLQQERSGDSNADAFVVPFIETLPTLEEMTRAALNILDNDPDGFFVMIEGGAIDWASHDNQFGRMIEEEIDFNHAVAAVVQWVETSSDWDETLVIVTADHETGYFTGPNSGKKDNGKSVWNPLTNRGKGIMPGMQWNSDGHTNSLVPFFAKGAGNEIFHQFADQTDSVRGRYLDNAELGQALLLLFEKNKESAKKKKT